VAGMVALMLQLYPDWQVADVKKLLINGSKLLTTKYTPDKT
jgi:hypothetical protein